MKLRAKALWVLMGDGGAKLFGLLATLILARAYGVESYGEITYALSILGVAGLFTDLGLHTLGTRISAIRVSRTAEVADDDKNNNKADNVDDHKDNDEGAVNRTAHPEYAHPANLFWLRILLALSVLAIFSLIIWGTLASQPQLRALTLLFLLSVVPQSLQTEWHFRGTQRFRWYSLSRWIQSLTYLIGLLLLVQTQTILLVPVLFSISILCAVLFQWAGYKPLRELFQRPKTDAWKPLLRSGLYLTAGSFLFQTVILLPPILMETRFSLYQLGLFGAMFKLILAAMIADRVFTTLLLPNLTVLHQQQSANLSQEIRPIVVWMLFFGLMGSLLLTTLASGLTEFLFGDQYLEGATGLPILSLFLPITFVNSIFLFGLISAGHDRSYLQAGLWGGTSAVLLMIAGTLSGSYWFFLISIPLAEAAITFAVYRAYRQTVPAIVPMRTWKLIGAYALAAGVGLAMTGNSGLNLTSSVPGWFPWIAEPSGSTPAHQFVIATLSLLLFFAVARIAGGINRHDLQWLKRRLQ